MDLTSSILALMIGATTATAAGADGGSPARGDRGVESPSLELATEPGPSAPVDSVEPVEPVEPAEYDADLRLLRLYGGVAFGVGAPGGAGIFSGLAPTRSVSFEWFVGGGNFGLALALGNRLTPLHTTYVDLSFAFMASLSINAQAAEHRYPTVSRWYSGEIGLDFRLFDEPLEIGSADGGRQSHLGQRLRLAGGWTLLGNGRDFGTFDECASLGVCDFGPGNGGATLRDARDDALAGEATSLPYLRLDWYAYFDL